MLSSLENTAGAARAQQGNIGIKCKNVSEPVLMADATRSTRIVMATQMKTISDASLQVEWLKMDL